MCGHTQQAASHVNANLKILHSQERPPDTIPHADANLILYNQDRPPDSNSYADVPPHADAQPHADAIPHIDAAPHADAISHADVSIFHYPK